MPRLCEFYPGICLTTEEKAWKNLSQGKKNKRVFWQIPATSHTPHKLFAPPISKRLISTKTQLLHDKTRASLFQGTEKISLLV